MLKNKYPLIGIGIMIKNKKGEVLLGLRQGSHGAGEWSFPGGHQQWGETMLAAARREVMEETGLKVSQFELISMADESRYLKSDNKHYVNIGFRAKYVSGKPKVKEPDKCKKWQWFSLRKLPRRLLQGTESIIKNYQTGKIFNP